MIWLGIGIGVFVGAFLGVAMMALFNAGGDNK